MKRAHIEPGRITHKGDKPAKSVFSGQGIAEALRAHDAGGADAQEKHEPKAHAHKRRARKPFFQQRGPGKSVRKIHALLDARLAKGQELERIIEKIGLNETQKQVLATYVLADPPISRKGAKRILRMKMPTLSKAVKAIENRLQGKDPLDHLVEKYRSWPEPELKREIKGIAATRTELRKRNPPLLTAANERKRADGTTLLDEALPARKPGKKPSGILYEGRRMESEARARIGLGKKTREEKTGNYALGRMRSLAKRLERDGLGRLQAAVNDREARVLSGAIKQTKGAGICSLSESVSMRWQEVALTARRILFYLDKAILPSREETMRRMDEINAPTRGELHRRNPEVHRCALEYGLLELKYPPKEIMEIRETLASLDRAGKAGGVLADADKIERAIVSKMAIAKKPAKGAWLARQLGIKPGRLKRRAVRLAKILKSKAV